MEDEYTAAYKELTAGDGVKAPVDDAPLEDPKPTVSPEKQAAMTQSSQEAQAFADAWNEGEQTASVSDLVKKGAKALGDKLLGSGTKGDATPDARAKKLQDAESASVNGGAQG